MSQYYLVSQWTESNYSDYFGTKVYKAEDWCEVLNKAKEVIGGEVYLHIDDHEIIEGSLPDLLKNYSVETITEEEYKVAMKLYKGTTGTFFSPKDFLDCWDED